MTRHRFKPLLFIVVAATLCLLAGSALTFAQEDGESGYTPPTMGAEDAPITVIEYGDFVCPNCGIFSREVMPRIKEAYVDTGVMRFEFRHFPWMSPESRRAAHASVCAHAQGKFWEYHDLLYQRQAEGFSDAKLNEAAASLSLDTEAFAACLADESQAAIVDADYRDARSKALLGTPTFFVNGRRVVGPIPFPVWQQFVEVLLAEMGS